MNQSEERKIFYSYIYTETTRISKKKKKKKKKT